MSTLVPCFSRSFAVIPFESWNTAASNMVISIKNQFMMAT